MMMKMLLLSLIFLVILNEHEDKACEIEIRALDTARDQEISWNNCKTFEKIQKHYGIKSSIRMSCEQNLKIIKNSKTLQNSIVIIKQRFEVYDEVREDRHLTTKREPTAEIDHLLLAASTARTPLIIGDHVLLS